MQEPAETSPADSSTRPRMRERGRMRRRLRRQRQMREALLLDLGALVFELHRHGRREPELLQAKAAELSAVDEEVRALADALDEDESVLELMAAGIAGACEECGALLSTDSRYCPSCGRPAAPALERPDPAQPSLEALDGAPLTTHGLEPRGGPEPEAPAPEPAPVAPWLVGREPPAPRDPES